MSFATNNQTLFQNRLNSSSKGISNCSSKNSRNNLLDKHENMQGVNPENKNILSEAVYAKTEKPYPHNQIIKLINSPIKEFVDSANSSFDNEIRDIDGSETRKTMLKKETKEDPEYYNIDRNSERPSPTYFPDVDLKCKYSEIGVMRINFFDILQEKEEIIRKRTSRVFRSFSHYYVGKDKVNNVNNNLNANINSPRKSSLPLPAENCNTNSNNLNASPNKNIVYDSNCNSKPNSQENEYVDIEGKIIKFNIFDSINSAFCQEVFHNNREIGKIDGLICINKIPSIKQIMCGVHTERGLDISSNYLTIPNSNNNLINTNNLNSHNIQASNVGNANAIIKENDKENLPSELKQINLKCEVLLSKLIQKSSFNFKEISVRDLNSEITSALDGLVKLLSTSINQSCLVYSYNSEEAIASAQNTFLDLGSNIIAVLDDMINDQRQLSYKILLLIIDRTELDLVNMSLTKNFNNSNSFKELKYKVIEKFLIFMTQMLDYTLEKLGRKVNDNNLKNFIENYLAYSYFRIPKVF